MFKKRSTSRSNVVTRSADGLISIRKAPSLAQNRLGNMVVVGKRKKRTEVKRTAKFEIHDKKLSLDLPLRTVSEANCFEHWTKKHKRHKDQQRMVAIFLRPHRDKIKLPCKIMLTRFAPDKLDAFENLPMSFKYVVDAVCAIITGDYRAGRADSDDRISLACNQVQSKEYGIRIEITSDD